MKIYYVANTRMPTERAHGIQLIKMCEAFISEGGELELLVPRLSGDAEYIKIFYGLKLPVPVRKMPAFNFYDFGRVGFIVSSISFAASYFIWLVLKRILGEKFIVYTVDLDHFSFLPLAILGVPYFIEIHGEKKKTFLHKFFFKRANGVFAINRFIKENLMKNFNLPSEKIALSPNGIDMERFALGVSRREARIKLNLPLDKRLILYVGRFYDWKGLEILFSAAEKLGQDFIFYFVGGTSDEAEAFTKTKAIPPNIIFIGTKDYKEIPLWLSVADALLLFGTAKNEASYYYTSPMKLFEYMASRCPIVASRTPANEAIVSDAEVFFYEPDKPESLARQIEEVFRNPVLAGAKIDATFQRIREFSWQKRASSIMSFIKNKI